MTAAELFRRRGPDEPGKPGNLAQSSPDYTAGREDYLFGRMYRAPAGAWERANAYSCGWNHERLDLEAATGRRAA
jgi:hypothetical protein